MEECRVHSESGYTRERREAPCNVYSCTVCAVLDYLLCWCQACHDTDTACALLIRQGKDQSQIRTQSQGASL